jgi:hypothetical protein
MKQHAANRDRRPRSGGINVVRTSTIGPKFKSRFDELHKSGSVHQQRESKSSESGRL